MLYIDTDVDAVNEITAPDVGGKLSEAETLLLPIHSTWNYRNSHVSQIESISRRWLFNIPRSQKTEGMRALGRLALLDHAERVKTRFRKAILSAADRDSIAATTGGHRAVVQQLRSASLRRRFAWRRNGERHADRRRLCRPPDAHRDRLFRRPSHRHLAVRLSAEPAGAVFGARQCTGLPP